MFRPLRLRCAKTAERIKMLFAVNILVCPRDIVLHGGSCSPIDRTHSVLFELSQSVIIVLTFHTPVSPSVTQKQSSNMTFSSRLKTKTLLNVSVISSVHCDVVNIPLGLGVCNKRPGIFLETPNWGVV